MTIKRRRKGSWVEVDPQILRWRKHHQLNYTKETKLRLGRPKKGNESSKEGNKPLDVTRYNFFGTSDE